VTAVATTGRRILVTPRSLTSSDIGALPTLAPLRERGYTVVAGPAGRVPTPDDLRLLLPGVVGWLAGIEQVTADVLDAAPDLRVISRNGTGSENIDHAAAQARGIAVRTAGGANAQGVAELALAHVMNAVRELSWSDAALHRGEWTRTRGREIAELEVGVVGQGAIGAKVAGIFAALGARVHYYDPFVVDAGPYIRHDDLQDLLAACDVVSLHVPPIGARPLIGATEVDALRQGAVLVNTARSALIEEEAVLAGLYSGRIGCYAVDAFDQEPPALTPLLQHPRTVMTPHAGGFTGASVRRATEQAVVNIIESLETT
jgi:phosphoglycerate dehydrogenase-like enzyme